MATKKSVFETLSAIDLSSLTKKKANQTYLSWAHAWAEVKKHYPSANFIVVKNEDGKPYIFDEKLGYMVMTSVTIEEETLEMWLPVMDGANKAMTDVEYEYIGWEWRNGKKTQVTKKVEKASMFDINKTIMRCLTKNLAMFGLGHYIYAGEDYPENMDATTNVEAQKPSDKVKTVDTKAKTLIPLKENDDNWGLAIKYAVTNKSKGLEAILKQLNRKYTIDKETIAVIEERINQK